MISFSGEVNISLTKEELEVLLSVTEGAIMDCCREGDEPSDAVMSVWRKVAILKGLDESSCQWGATRGGDSAAQAIEVERISRENKAAEYNRLPLYSEWGQS